MKNQTHFKELEKLLSGHTVSIRYQPGPKEIDYNNFFLIRNLQTENLLLPTNKDSDAFAWSDICTNKYRNATPHVLIPGTKFDMHGNRKGRGGGWYDRFLSKIPREWLRIGVAHISRVLTSEIEQNIWDQKVDWLIIWNGDSWDVHRCQKSDL